MVGIFWTSGMLALWKLDMNFLNFIALPVSFGVGRLRGQHRRGATSSCATRWRCSGARETASSSAV